MGTLLGLNKDVVRRVVKEIGLQTIVDGNPRSVVEDIDVVLVCNPERIVDTVAEFRQFEDFPPDEEEQPPI